MDTLENLNRKLAGAKDINSVVKAMKAMAAANISQYEAAVASLGDYYYTVTLGTKAYLTSEQVKTLIQKPITEPAKEHPVCAIVFGSDLGLVGQFSDLIWVRTRVSTNGSRQKRDLGNRRTCSCTFGRCGCKRYQVVRCPRIH